MRSAASPAGSGQSPQETGRTGRARAARSADGHRGGSRRGAGRTAAGAAVAGTWPRPPRATRAAAGRIHQVAPGGPGPSIAASPFRPPGPAAHVLPAGRAHRRIHFGGPDLAAGHSAPFAAPRRPVPGRPRPARPDRHLRGRSIVETLPGQINGCNAARTWRAQGYHGCWVFGLGKNDAANVAAGSAVGGVARIGRLMSAAHGQPVPWVNTRTLLTSGPWASESEQLFNQGLCTLSTRAPSRAMAGRIIQHGGRRLRSGPGQWWRRLAAMAAVGNEWPPESGISCADSCHHRYLPINSCRVVTHCR
jgi:hypothetical protein